MPGVKRLVLPNYPHHIVHRGHNRQGVFTNDEYRWYYLRKLKQWKDELRCRIYSYCLMTNHVHIIVDPGEKAENLGRLMRVVAGSLTLHVNKLDSRKGTLWEGKYRSSIIDADSYLLACCRYIEMNPLRAGIVKTPEEYPWSSCRIKTGMMMSELVDADPLYLRLGNTKKKRQKRYGEWMRKQVPKDESGFIRNAVHKGHLTGGRPFVEQVFEHSGRRVEPKKRGRPPRVRRNITSETNFGENHLGDQLSR